MSIIGIKGVPRTWTLSLVVKTLARTINGHFEALKFELTKGQDRKKCYIKLSKKLDPQQVLERINSVLTGNIGRLTAFIPSNTVDLSVVKKVKGLPQKNVAVEWTIQYYENSPGKRLVETHSQIMTELQSKYPGLYNLSMKTGHKLLDNVSKIVFLRLKKILLSNPEANETCFKLSKWYRKVHPHFGDFQLVLSTLHRAQDAAATPRSQVLEHELAVVSTQQHMINDIPFNEVKPAIVKYTERIIKKVSEHLRNLKSDIDPTTDSEDEIARKKVREELKKLAPYLPEIIRQATAKHLSPQKSTGTQQIRMYGEPFLPTRHQVLPFLRRYSAVNVHRSTVMYNLVRATVPAANYGGLVSMDGAVIGGAKLVIRPAADPKYAIQEDLAAEMEMFFNVDGSGAPALKEEFDMDHV